MKKNVLRLCRKLAVKKLLKSKAQSIGLIVSVILTTILFTTAFSTVFYFQDSVRKVALENASWTAHGAVAEVTDEQYEQMKQNHIISDISCYQHLGFLKEETQDEVIEIEYSEDTLAKWMNFSLSWGKMPQQKSEVALSQQLLDSKNIPSDPSAEGTAIHLRYEVNGTLKEGDFTISGAYKQKPTSNEVLFVSQAFFEEELSSMSGEENRDSMLGKRVVEIMFPDTSQIDKMMEQFVIQTGVQDHTWFLNPAYADDSQTDPGITAAVILVLFLIMCCAYFIITNIFYISVTQDTRFYGSLSTLGFTKKEILRMMRIKSDILCLISIPVGLASGFLLVRNFLPDIMQPFITIDIQDIPGPLMFVSAAVFAYITVHISCRKPAHIAAEMPPIEAKKYVPVKSRKKKISRNGQKIWVMAWKNVTRERLKSVFIICSVMICIVLASFFYTMSRGFDMDIYLQNAIRNDFIVGGSNYFNRMEPDPSAIDTTLLQTLQQTDGIIQSGGACFCELDVPLDDNAYQKLLKLAGEDYFYQDGIMHTTLVYGLDDYIFSQMTATKGTLDPEKFQTGNYIVVSGFFQSPDNESCYEPGDKLKLPMGDRIIEYTVMAISELPNDYSVRHRYADSIELYLPAQEWSHQMRSQDYYMYAFDVKEDCRLQWEDQLSDMADSGREFAYQSKSTFRKQFERFSEGFLMLGIAVSTILGIIGLMNFINVLYSSVYDRRHELAVMQSMGMSTRQVYGMLIAEGGYYMLAAWLCSIIFNLPVTCYMMTSLSEIRYFHYQFYPQTFFIPVLIGCLAAFCVPCTIFYTMTKKEDLVDRLRAGIK